MVAPVSGSSSSSSAQDNSLGAALGTNSALGEQDAPLSEILAGYGRYVATGEINSEVEDQAAATERVRAEFASRPGITADGLDGLTITGDGWWFNLRPSNTEPLLRLNLEASDEDTMLRLRDEVLGIVRG